MSRQMAFQFSGPDFCAMIDRIERLSRAAPGGVPSKEADKWIEQTFPEPCEQRVARASMIAAIRCYDTGRDYRRVKKIIVWRDASGKPADIQIEF